MKKSITIFLVALMLLLSGCANTKSDSVFDRNNPYVRLIQNFQLGETEELDENFEALEEYNIIGTYVPDNWEKLKEQIIEFFKTNYEVDVSDRINTAVFYYTDSLHEYNNGAYDHYQDKILLQKSKIDKMEENIKFAIVVHELFHYLGINTKEDDLLITVEIINSAVVNQFMKEIGRKQSNEDLYQYIQQIGGQLVTANPRIVTDLMENSKTVKESLEEVLAKAKYNYGRFEGWSVAEFYEAMIQNLLYNPDVETVFMVEEYTLFYCRQFDLNEEQIETIKRWTYFENFDQIKLEYVEEEECYNLVF